MSEVTEKKQKKVQNTVEVVQTQPQTKNDLIAALNKDFATSVTKVYINSLDREVGFSEITVKEQKTLTRIMAGNENRKDVLYDAQCALINKACLEEGFDIYDLLEFDRLKLMIAIYQANTFEKNEMKFTCDKCGAENVYQLDFDNVIKRLDMYDISPKDFEYENNKFKCKFKLQFPTVKNVKAFYVATTIAPFRPRTKQQIQTDENLTNIDYVNLFIKTIELTNKVSDKTTFIDFSNYEVADVSEILNNFPQDLLYNSEHGVVKYIVEEFIEKLNTQFDKHTCFNCGAIHEKGDVNNSEAFF